MRFCRTSHRVLRDHVLLMLFCITQRWRGLIPWKAAVKELTVDLVLDTLFQCAFPA
jgi:hypothetical protein